jgi:hypothetical protein
MKAEEMSLALFRLPPIFETAGIPASRTGFLMFALNRACRSHLLMCGRKWDADRNSFAFKLDGGIGLRGR